MRTHLNREEKVSFPNALGYTLSGVLHIPENPAGKPAVILCHGMESNKESEKLTILGRRFSERGISALRFDFFCAGESSGRFAEITYTGEVADTRAAFELIQGHRPGKIGMIGSSMGGSVSLLFASQERRVSAVATLAAPAHPERIIDTLLSQDQVEDWRQQGFVTYHGRRINSHFLDDVRKIDIPKAAIEIFCPSLIIHGDSDDTVPAEDAHEIHTLIPGPKRLSIIEGADHRFSDPRHLSRAVEESFDWMVQHLFGDSKTTGNH